MSKMRDREPQRDFLARLISWAGQHALIRASLLTSTRATSPASVDLLSDYGYRLLLDKDGLAPCLPPPTFPAYVAPKPSAQREQEVVEEFWWETTYVAKYLWRGELVAARTVLDRILRAEVLHPMLEWLI